MGNLDTAAPPRYRTAASRVYNQQLAGCPGNGQPSADFAAQVFARQLAWRREVRPACLARSGPALRTPPPFGATRPAAAMPPLIRRRLRRGRIEATVVGARRSSACANPRESIACARIGQVDAARDRFGVRSRSPMRHTAGGPSAARWRAGAARGDEAEQRRRSWQARRHAIARRRASVRAVQHAERKRRSRPWPRYFFFSSFFASRSARFLRMSSSFDFGISSDVAARAPSRAAGAR